MKTRPHFRIPRCHICHNSGIRTVLVAGNYGLCACLCRKPKEATALFRDWTTIKPVFSKVDLTFFPVEIARAGK